MSKLRASRQQIAARRGDLQRLADALRAADALLGAAAVNALTIEHKQNGDPVTDAEHAVNQLLQRMLVAPGEGWLSEETRDDRDRLTKSRVWIVDPVDGTKELISGIPEWCVSIGLVEDGRAVAGGILNPATGELFIGSLETGLTERPPVRARQAATKPDCHIVLASRSEVKRGEWERFRNAPFTVQPMGSVAYKLALVAGGLADATWTLVAKNEWDVAAGVALVLSAGGSVHTPAGKLPQFNKAEPRFDGLIATSREGARRLRGFLPASAATKRARTLSAKRQA